MKITIEHYDSKITLEEPDDLDINEMVAVLRKILFALGYHIDNINDVLPEE